MFGAERNKYYIEDVEIFPCSHEYPFAARLFWQATPTDPLVAVTLLIENGLPDIQESHSTTLKYKCRPSQVDGITVKNTQTETTAMKKIRS